MIKFVTFFTLLCAVKSFFIAAGDSKETEHLEIEEYTPLSKSKAANITFNLLEGLGFMT
jgi:hypothetical protein